MEKRKNGKRRQNLIIESWFSFPQYTWPLSKLEDSGLIGAKTSVMKSFIGRKEKRTNLGNDKQHTLILLHNTKSHTQHLY